MRQDLLPGGHIQASERYTWLRFHRLDGGRNETQAEAVGRDITIGGGGRLITALGSALPRLTDFSMERAMFDAQRAETPAVAREGNLYAPAAEGSKERGTYPGHVMRSSLYTKAAMLPGKALIAAGLGLAVFAGIRSLARSDD